MMEVHSKHRGVGTILGVKVKREMATHYGCIVHDSETAQVLHYVEKPDSWISDVVNGGVYCGRTYCFDPFSSLSPPVFDKSLFDEIKVAMDDKTARAAEDPLIQSDEILRLEQDVIVPLAATRKMYMYQTNDFWRQMKTAA